MRPIKLLAVLVLSTATILQASVATALLQSTKNVFRMAINLGVPQSDITGNKRLIEAVEGLQIDGEDAALKADVLKFLASGEQLLDVPKSRYKGLSDLSLLTLRYSTTAREQGFFPYTIQHNILGESVHFRQIGNQKINLFAQEHFPRRTEFSGLAEELYYTLPRLGFFPSLRQRLLQGLPRKTSPCPVYDPRLSTRRPRLAQPG